MKYTNPVIKGFYPDPSVCFANGKYYLVCSSFQYFPGVPVFESEDLVNWKQVGNALTRPSQIELETVPSSGGVFAPTIRYHEGVFYMVTTNDTLHKNFYVTTTDIRGEWSEPIFVDQGGIDPSLLFDGGKVYFISNGQDDEGSWGITQCEIDIKTGAKLTPSKAIWQGSGGRYLESPHMYHLKDGYYLMAAEGGTEYGHMITYARGDSPWGPFEPYEKNPVLTNRNRGGFQIQGVGHGDLIQGPDGNWYILHLGFRQIGQYDMYHHLGREVFLTPVHFLEDGWFTAGNDGTTDFTYETGTVGQQQEQKLFTFKNTDFSLDWLMLRKPQMENYELGERVILHGSEKRLNDSGSPTFIGIRQRDFKGSLRCTVSLRKSDSLRISDFGTAGITVYMDEQHHYDLYLSQTRNEVIGALDLYIGDASCTPRCTVLSENSARLRIDFDNYNYRFCLNDELLGSARTKYVSTEVAGGFTGVLFGLYACDRGAGEFSDFEIVYE